MPKNYIGPVAVYCVNRIFSCILHFNVNIKALSLSLELHDGRKATGHLMKVMLRQNVRTKGHAEGAGGELPHHRRGEGAERTNRRVEFLLH